MPETDISETTAPTTIEAITYGDIAVGQRAEYRKQITEKDILLFAAVSGDVNPLHLDADYAAGTDFGERIAHGMLTGAVISAAIAMTMPGPGSVYLSQSLQFLRPVKIDDEITIELEVTEKRDARGVVVLRCTALNAAGKAVVKGIAEVKAPIQAVKVTLAPTPTVSVGA
ncbi:MAG: MaoC family dehydratase [Pseudomonadota bacterium]